MKCSLINHAQLIKWGVINVLSPFPRSVSVITAFSKATDTRAIHLKKYCHACISCPPTLRAEESVRAVNSHRRFLSGGQHYERLEQ